MNKLHDAASEALFEPKIDAEFPYQDLARGIALIEEATSISLNAAFCVLDEICRPPFNAAVTRERQHELVAMWTSRVEHPLKNSILKCAAALIDGQGIAHADAFTIMERVADVDGQRAALGIVYFSAQIDQVDTLEPILQRITDGWAARGL